MNAWLDWIDGITPVNASITSKGSKITGTPAILEEKSYLVTVSAGLC
jgi:hypothetical protein